KVFPAGWLTTHLGPPPHVGSLGPHAGPAAIGATAPARTARILTIIEKALSPVMVPPLRPFSSDPEIRLIGGVVERRDVELVELACHLRRDGLIEIVSTAWGQVISVRRRVRGGQLQGVGDLHGED